MFSARTSRSQSISSVQSLDLNNGPTEKLEPEIDTDVPNTQRWVDDPSYRFTASHPIGSILLKIVQDTTNLAKKNNSKSMATNIDELCTAFHNGIKLERASLNNKYDSTIADVEKSLMDKELNAHTINAAIMPPTEFSNEPKIGNVMKLGEVIKVFPKASRFSGNLQKDGNYSVVEFLNALTAAQKQCKLSEEEFIDRILASSTGLAHDLILEWKSNGDNASTIYHSLLVNFDSRMTPEEARSKLANFTINKNSNLARAESNIQLLVGRAAAQFPFGESRNAYRNMEGCSTLIRALPPYSSLTANNLYQNYTTRLGRACTMHELFRGLDQYRGVIDRDIKANGTSNMPKFTPMKGGINRKYSSFSTAVQMGGNNNNRQDKIRPLPPPPMIANKQNDVSYTPKPIVRNFNNRPRPQNNNYRYKNNRPYNKFNNNNQNNNYKRLSCPLCGKNHKADECTNVRDDSGNILKMHPTHGVCSKCPSFVRPRLHHPEVACPYRVGGPLNRSKN
jgi:hypothetical protein